MGRMVAFGEVQQRLWRVQTNLSPKCEAHCGKVGVACLMVFGAAPDRLDFFRRGDFA